MAAAARTASLATDPDLETAVRRVVTAAHPQRTVELDARQPLVRVTLGQEAFQLMALVGRTARPVKVLALESAAHPAVSAVRLLHTVAQVARRGLVILIRAQEGYRLTVCAERTARPVREQQVLEIVVRQPGFAVQLLHTAAQVRVARQLMATVS